MAPTTQLGCGGGRGRRINPPEHNIRLMVDKVIVFAKKAAREMQTALDPHFASEAFALCRHVVGTIHNTEFFDRAIEETIEESETEPGRQSDFPEDLPLSQVIQGLPSRQRRPKRAARKGK